MAIDPYHIIGIRIKRKELTRTFMTVSKWNESGFRPPLCTYRLNWARRTSWGWWDDWDDTVLQTQDSKFEPWRSEAEHATSRSRRLPTILTFTRGWGRNNFVSFKPPRPGTEPRTLAWKAAVLTTTLGPPPMMVSNWKELWSPSTVDGLYTNICTTSAQRLLGPTLYKRYTNVLCLLDSYSYSANKSSQWLTFWTTQRQIPETESR